MTENRYFNSVPEFMRSTKFLQGQVNVLNSAVQDINNFTGHYAEELEPYIMTVREKANNILDCTGAILEDLHYMNEDLSYLYEMMQNEIVIADVRFENGILHVFTPLTFKHNWNMSYVFYKSTMIGLDNWERKNNTRLWRCIKMPFWCVAIRKAPRFNHKTFADNDNKESGNIINAVVRHCGMNDRADVMTFVSRFQLVESKEQEGMEFIFVSEETLKEHPELVFDWKNKL